MAQHNDRAMERLLAKFGLSRNDISRNEKGNALVNAVELF
jgi:hypothetical protein